MNGIMRPTLKFLSNELIEEIVSEAYSILTGVGLEIDNPELVKTLLDHGGALSNDRVCFSLDMIENALKTVPDKVCLYDVHGEETHQLGGFNSYFTPGSSALNILDQNTGKSRKPVTGDYIDYAKVMCGLDNLSAQSTAFIPADVPDQVGDSYRLFLSLLYCPKPVITGSFSIEGFSVIRDLLTTVRGSSENLKEKPLAIFSCCPTAPLKWSDITSHNLVDCAREHIPVELISMPLAGMVSPVTLTGTITQHTAENLGGLVISQVISPGTPIIWGGSPAPFDMRYETTPMGAIETMMIDCGCNEVGKFLGLPTQAYISLSDSKLLDAQAGMETGMGAVLATLSGINSISGPGMLDFENCQSLQKLVLDNEIAGMCSRMTRGIRPKNDFPIVPLMTELLGESHLLISSHTLENLRSEHYFPGPVIDRLNHSRWSDEGGKTLGQRANEIIKQLINGHPALNLDKHITDELYGRMAHEAGKYGMSSLPLD